MPFRITATTWAPCYRIIPSRFPPVGLFDKVTDPADLEAVFLIEAMTRRLIATRTTWVLLSTEPASDRNAGGAPEAVWRQMPHP